MNSIPEPPADPIVDVAEMTLRAFGTDLDRVTAQQLLKMWRHYRRLTPEQAEAVVLRFPEYPYRVPLGEGNTGPGGPLGGVS